MSEAIKVGDLVQVVAPPRCPNAPDNADLGHTFFVEKIVDETSGVCGYCFGLICNPRPALLLATVGREAYPFYRLKRLPPLEELDDVKRNEEITA